MACRSSRSSACGRARRLVVGSVLLALTLATASAADHEDGCPIDHADPSRPGDGRAWLEAQDETIARALSEEHVAFLPTGRFASCPQYVPALVLFEKPWQEVFALLLATERHGEFLPKLGALTPISRAPMPHVDRHELAILFRTIVFYVEQQWNTDERRIWWRLSPDHPNDIQAISGFWELHPLEGGRTLGVYGTFVDIGPVLPRRMQSALTQRNLRSSIRNLRVWVDSGGRQRGLRGR